MKQQIAIALSTAALLLITFGLNTHATTNTHSHLVTQSSSTTYSFSDQELIAFIQAVKKIQETPTQFDSEISTIDPKAQLRKLDQQENLQTRRAIRSTGLSVALFSIIATQLLDDPDLVERLFKLSSRLALDLSAFGT
ncbi:DUF4168 domain-containing protein [Orrella sp. 11846]|uniref:DUF4168 domain-containing protein n=1 Tax=Orrella sp. 11846 TaxID=3409913 RepID=UPI003B5ADE3A